MAFGAVPRSNAIVVQEPQPIPVLSGPSLATACGATAAQAAAQAAAGPSGGGPALMSDVLRRTLFRAGAQDGRSGRAIEEQRRTAIVKGNTRRRGEGLEVRSIMCPLLSARARDHAGKYPYTPHRTMLQWSL